ncbi:DUF1622 domain-containing protein [Bernardetia sp. Wsw4-3y2]|uniref:DUF1622 domain-containing protein n=1 Tax=unclassified Bernardetia TaxID=2647129 RepID=UPI0030D1C7A9
MELIRHYIHYVAISIEVLGILTIILGIFYAFFLALTKTNQDKYTLVRQKIGKAILLGLEILVAADIISTIVTEPTLNQVLTLGLIVLIRTFLSLSLQVELEGRFPWQRKDIEKEISEIESN